MQWTGGRCVLRLSQSFSFRRLLDPFPLLPAGLWSPALLPGSVPGAVHGAGLLPCLGGVSALQRYCYTADPVNISTSFKRVKQMFWATGTTQNSAFRNLAETREFIKHGNNTEITLMYFLNFFRFSAMLKQFFFHPVLKN